MTSPEERLGRQIDGLFSEQDERQLPLLERLMEIDTQLAENGFVLRPNRVVHLVLSRKILFVKQAAYGYEFSFDDMEDLLNGAIDLPEEDVTEFNIWYQSTHFPQYARLKELDELLKNLGVDDAGRIVDFQREADEIYKTLDRDAVINKALEYEYGETDPARLKLLRSILPGRE